MKKKLIVGSIILGAVLLTGCNDNSSSEDDNNPISTVEQAHQNIIGSWLMGYVPGGCEDNSFENYIESDKDVITFSNSDAVIVGKEYNNSNCDESGVVFHDVTTYEYEISGTGTGSKGEDAFNMDLTLTDHKIIKSDGSIVETDPTDKLMFLFDGDHLVLSIDDNLSLEHRPKDFNMSDYWIKQ